MIRSTTDPVFLRWGTPVSAMGEERCLQEVRVSSEETVTMYCPDRESLWSYDSGMTVLLIADGEELHRFYLDRTVRLREGVRFGFAPLQGSSYIVRQSAFQPNDFADGTVPCPRLTAALQPMQIFTCLSQQAEDGFYFSGEQHLPMELVWLKRGVLHNYCGGEDRVLRAKELLLIPSDQWHIQYAEDSVQFLTVSFLWEGRDFGHLTGEALKVTPEAERYLTAIEQELSERRPDRDEFMHAALKLLLIHLQRQGKTVPTVHHSSPASEQMHRQIIDKAMQAVSANIQGRYSVPELAAAVNVSQTHLTNLFQLYLGMSPAKYITRIRVEECKRLLSSGELSVGEIAEMMGYSSIPHFCKQFRQWTGGSPAGFARQRRQETVVRHQGFEVVN